MCCLKIANRDQSQLWINDLCDVVMLDRQLSHCQVTSLLFTVCSLHLPAR